MKNKRKNIDIAKELKKIKKSLEKLQGKIKKYYYKPIKTKDAFNNNYIENFIISNN